MLRARLTSIVVTSIRLSIPVRPVTPVRLALQFAMVAAVFLSAGVTVPTVQAAEQVPPAGELAIGDSVMLGGRWAMRRRGIDAVNAKVSRQATSAPGIMRRLGPRLPRNIVIHLGTNGTFPMSTCRDIVRVAGPHRRVYLVTLKVPRTWEKSNNAVIRACARRFPQQVQVIDWNWAASHHRGWLYSDGIHLRPAGARGYARVIANALARESTSAV